MNIYHSRQFFLQGGFVAQYASVMHEHASAFAETWSAGTKSADLLEGVRQIGLANMMHWALGLQHHGTSGSTWEIALTMHEFSKVTFERMPAAFKEGVVRMTKQCVAVMRRPSCCSDIVQQLLEVQIVAQMMCTLRV